MTEQGSGDDKAAQYRDLLDDVSKWLSTEIQRHTKQGERFNAFTSIASPHDENRHSRVIATLLDPAGSHWQGLLFLRLLVEELGLGDHVPALENPGAWRISTEASLGEGSRIDILVEAPGFVMGIENKVYAEEGSGQLRGYAGKLGDRDRCAILVFLTLNGREPDDGRDRLARFNITQVKICSYYEVSPQISSLERWLKRSIKELINAPPVQQFVNQYLQLIAELGGRSMNSETSRTLAQNLLNDPERFAAARDIADALFERRVDLQCWFWRELEKALELSGVTVDRLWNTDPASVRRHLRGESKIWPGMRCDTQLTWAKYRIFISLEMLDAPERPYLTWKVMCASNDTSGDPVIRRVQVPNYAELDAVLATLELGWESTGWSFLTADLELPNAHRLDLTHFSGRAEQLAGPEAGTVVQDVAQKVQELQRSVAECFVSTSEESRSPASLSRYARESTGD